MGLGIRQVTNGGASFFYQNSRIRFMYKTNEHLKEPSLISQEELDKQRAARKRKKKLAAKSKRKNRS